MALTFNHNDKLFVSGSNVGIGNNEPTQALTVEGAISSSGDIYIGNNNEVNSLHFRTTSGQISRISGHAELSFYSDNTINFIESDASAARLVAGTNSGTFNINTNSEFSSSIKLYVNGQSYLTDKTYYQSPNVYFGTGVAGPSANRSHYNRINLNAFSSGSTYAQAISFFGNRIEYVWGGGRKFSVDSGGSITMGQSFTSFYSAPSSGIIMEGKAGIGVHNPTSFNSNADNLVVGTSAGNSGITIYSGASNTGGLYFADASGSGAGNRDGVISYSHNNGTMSLRTGGNQGVLSLSTGTSTFHMGNVVMENNLTVKGRVTAEEFHTEFVSASIMYDSGSTKFGDTVDDLHSFTGSVDILTSTFAGNRSFIISGSAGPRLQRRGDTSGWAMEYGFNSNDNTDQGGFGALGNNTSLTRYYIGSYGAEHVTVLNNGNVGMGTVSPVTRLHLHTENSNPTYLQFTNYTTGTTANDGLTVGLNGAEDGVIFLREENDLFFGTNDLERMRITSDGNVGIGTTTPDSILDIRKASGTYNNAEPLLSMRGGNVGGNQVHKFEYTGDAGIYTLGYAGLTNDRLVLNGGSGNSGPSILFYDNANHTIQLAGSTTGTSFINAGNVGIGTTSPSAKVEIYRSGSTDLFRVGDGTNYMHWYGNGYNDINTYGSSFRVYAHTNDIVFRTGGADPSVTIKNGGNVGIGTSAPLFKFAAVSPETTGVNRVVGIFAKSGTSEGSTILRVGRTQLTSTTPSADVQVVDIEHNSGGAGPFRYGTYADGVISNGSSATNGPYGALHFATSGSVRMTVGGGTLAGYIGIGTTAPASPLHVNTGTGTGTANTVIIDRAVSSDYSGVSFATAGTVDWSIGQNSAGNFEVFEDGLDSKTRLTVKTGGNVGIGTTNPVAKLHVRGADSTASPSDNGIFTVENQQQEGISVGYDTDGNFSWFYSREVGVSSRAIRFNDALMVKQDDTIQLEKYGVGNKTGTPAYNLQVDSSGNIVETAAAATSAVGGSGVAEEVAVWSSASNVSGSQAFTWNGDRLFIDGVMEAREKSFNIKHPTKENKRLIYGVLEGPEHGVYCRGKVEGKVIELPEEWTGLVDEDTITVQLTSIGKHQNLYVKDIKDNKIFISNGNLLSSSIKAFYFVQAMRKDVKPLVTERDA